MSGIGPGGDARMLGTLITAVVRGLWTPFLIPLRAGAKLIIGSVADLFMENAVPSLDSKAPWCVAPPLPCSADSEGSLHS